MALKILIEWTICHVLTMEPWKSWLDTPRCIFSSFMLMIHNNCNILHHSHRPLGVGRSERCMGHVVQFLCMKCCSTEKYVLLISVHGFNSEEVNQILSTRSSIHHYHPCSPLIAHLNSARGCPSHSYSIAGGADGTQLDMLSVAIISPRCQALAR